MSRNSVPCTTGRETAAEPRRQTNYPLLPEEGSHSEAAGVVGDSIRDPPVTVFKQPQMK